MLSVSQLLGQGVIRESNFTTVNIWLSRHAEAGKWNFTQHLKQTVGVPLDVVK